MTADAAQREPTMEEILASIRRIISEEDQPESGGSDVLELSQTTEPNASFEETPDDGFDMEAAMRDIPPATQAAPARPVEDFVLVESADDDFAEPAAPSAPARPLAQEPGLVSDPAAQQAAGALGKLIGSLTLSSDSTVEGLVKDLLRPMLKEWLDANLPQIVESVVQKEVERIRRMAR
jgi:uncharacterized protein